MRLNHYHLGSGEPLVLIHGIGSRWQVWEPVLDSLSAKREVVALDLPGFGESPMPPPGTPPGAHSLTSLVSEFLGEIGLERPHVAGNSLGGWVALELAKLGRVRSATALSPGGFYNDPEAIFTRACLWTSVRAARRLAPRADRLLASALGRKLAFGQVAAKPERIPPADAAASVRALAGALWFDETLLAITADRFDGGDQVDVPVTIAWGQHDRLLLPRQAARAARAVPSARMIMLEGCGHVPFFDDPEQVARVLLDGSGG